MTHPILNLDALTWREIGAIKPGAPERYRGARLAPVGPHVGAQRLGYNVTELPPGKAAFPAHNHYANEELFFILEGTGEVRIGADVHPVRAGDFIACPPGGPETAHQIRNTGAVTLRYLAVSTTQTPDLVQYPDSGKTGANHLLGRDADGMPVAVRIMTREADSLDYWDGED